MINHFENLKGSLICNLYKDINRVYIAIDEMDGKKQQKYILKLQDIINPVKFNLSITGTVNDIMPEHFFDFKYHNCKDYREKIMNYLIQDSKIVYSTENIEDDLCRHIVIYILTNSFGKLYIEFDFETRVYSYSMPVEFKPVIKPLTFEYLKNNCSEEFFIIENVSPFKDMNYQMVKFLYDLYKLPGADKVFSKYNAKINLDALKDEDGD